MGRRRGGQPGPGRYPYELYDLTKDWTQFENVAAKYPGKVKELENLFWAEAHKYQVLPLDATFATRLVAPRPNLAAGRTAFTWSGEITGTPNGDAPFILNASYSFKAESRRFRMDRRRGHDRDPRRPVRRLRVLCAEGKPVFLWNLVDLKRVRWEDRMRYAGKHTLEFDFKYDGLGMGTLAFNNMSGIGRGGTGVLKVDGKEVARPDHGAYDPANPAVG